MCKWDYREGVKGIAGLLNPAEVRICEGEYEG